MSTKMQQLYVQQTSIFDGGPRKYRVAKLVNSVRFSIGELLTVETVESLCRGDGGKLDPWTVTVNGPSL